MLMTAWPLLPQQGLNSYKLFNKMLYKSNFLVETAVANQSGAMEADTISKNGRSLKSLTSKGNLMKSLILFCVLVCSSQGTWGQKSEFLFKENQNGLTIGLSIKLERNGIVLYSGTDKENLEVLCVSMIKDYANDDNAIEFLLDIELSELEGGGVPFCPYSCAKITAKLAAIGTYDKNKKPSWAFIVQHNSEAEFKQLLNAVKSKK